MQKSLRPQNGRISATSFQTRPPAAQLASCQRKPAKLVTAAGASHIFGSQLFVMFIAY